ncbi:MAG: MetQ/NlpA family ABC transporter substrate-binding protein [Neisseriaceae bacterium]|nr:MetQ/NlpA family ABC transporter substrate-binding protein [Neisseriaceae bacterium]MBP6861220.1 MetQ/NlpA family ABC transporter substrate-binding protein [Neisseriaceae bacterium]
MKRTSLTQKLLAVALIGGLLAGCSKGDTETDQAATHKALDPQNITVGAIGGPHEQILEAVKALAAKDGVTINVKVFNDFNIPNIALAEGSIDANSYQSLPFLTLQKQDQGFKLTEAFKTIALPMGIYSSKVTDLKDLKPGAKVGIPNDPANELRALQLFEAAGVITLKPGLTDKATKRDIAENPLNIDFQELMAPQIPTQLPELDAAAINTNFALHAGLTLKDALHHEILEGNPHTNYIVVRDENINDEAVKVLQKYYQSPEVKAFILETFNGSLIPSF